MTKEFTGELIGTFILVFIGCSSVASAVLYDLFNLLEVALIWGAGVTIAILSTRKICPAHLNPAVSTAMSMNGSLPWRKLPSYFLAQMTGAIIAGLAVFMLFSNHIEEFELSHEIIRGTDASRSTAMIFGEFFPNPGNTDLRDLHPIQAMLLEAGGTLMLVFVIFRLVDRNKEPHKLTPVFIGLTVTLIICIVAPYTQAGLNPARDLGPRLIAGFSGWADAAFPSPSLSFLTVYVAGPILGGITATLIHKRLK